MPEYLDIISKSLLFKGLAEPQLKEFIKIAVEKKIKKGDTVFFEGENANGFYLVLEGVIKVFKVSSDGKEQILHILGPGEPFGEVPVFSGQRFPANAEPIIQSRLLFFARKDFIGLISGNPSLALNMIAVLSMRLREFAAQIENLSLKEVPGRLATYLIYLSGEQNNNGMVNLDISKGQLASLLGTIPETLSRIFNRMSKQGLIKVKDRAVMILDPEGLETLAAYGKGAFNG